MALKLEPIRTQSVSEAVYDQLRQAILNGDIAPGGALPGERRLGEMLGVNRGAVREALKRLEQENLVSIQQGEPTRVKDFRSSARLDLLLWLMRTPSGEVDREVLVSVAELRGAITPRICRLAALREGRRFEAEFKRILDEMESSQQGLPPFHALVEAYWDTMVQGSQNVAYRLIGNTVREIHMEFAEYVRPMLYPELGNLERYQELTQAVVAREADRAEAIARTHCQIILQSLAGEKSA